MNSNALTVCSFAMVVQSVLFLLLGMLKSDPVGGFALMCVCLVVAVILGRLAERKRDEEAHGRRLFTGKLSGY